MYPAPPEIETHLFTRLPDEFRNKGEPNFWVGINKPGGIMDSFLEGPSFDRDGNLYCVDIPYGRIFRVSPAGKWTLAVDYDGEPNGLKIHRDGRLFIADQAHGIVVADPATGKTEHLVTRPNLERFLGCNDLVFATNGDLYFTDPGRSSLNHPTGRVFRLSADGELELLLDGAAYPNGLVLNADESALYIAVTLSNAIWRLPLNAGPMDRRAGLFIQMSGGVGPDGLALDAKGNLAVAHARAGTAWLFSPSGEPVARVRSCAGLATTNIAYGGADGKTLYIVESETGSILTAQMPVPGRPMYSHM
jgi:gluconolactonase